MDRAELLLRARTKGVNPFVYWLVRAVLQPFFHVWFRMSRIGREHIPAEGPVIFAANHRSFLDPFVIATLARRPIYFVAKRELFTRRPVAWILNSLGAFPIDRGAGDADAMATARAILERGDGVLIFPEGTRTRPGRARAAPARRRPPGAARPARPSSPSRSSAPRTSAAAGASARARSASAPGARCASRASTTRRRSSRARSPTASGRASRCSGSGSAACRRCAASPSSAPAAGAPRCPSRWRSAGPRGRARDAHGRAARPARRDARERPLPARRRAAGRRPRRARGRPRPRPRRPRRARRAGPRRSPPPSRRSATGSRRRPPSCSSRRASCPPPASSPAPTSAPRVRSRALAVLGGPGHAADALAHGAALVAASADADLARPAARAALRRRLRRRDHRPTSPASSWPRRRRTPPCSPPRRPRSSARTPPAPPPGRVFAELDAYARRHGGRPETFAGLAGAGRPRRHRRRRRQPQPPRRRAAGAGRPRRAHRPDARAGRARALDALPLLARTLAGDGVRAPDGRRPRRRRRGAHVGRGVGPLGHRPRLAPPGPRGLRDRLRAWTRSAWTASSPSSTGRT